METLLSEKIVVFSTAIFGFVGIVTMLFGLIPILNVTTGIKENLIVMNVGFVIGMISIMMYDEQCRNINHETEGKS